MQSIGKIVIIIGIIIIILGVVIYFFGHKLNWFGNLPGDIRLEKENFKLYIPITTMLLVSLALSLIIYLINKIFK